MDMTFSLLQEYVDNMGKIGESEMRWVDEKQLVSTHAGVQHGSPEAIRSILKLSETGAIRKASMERMTSDHRVEKAFWGEYTRKGEEKKVKN